MKRVKIALVALTVCAAVGGTLAFKANNFTAFHLYTTGGVTPNNGCTVDFGQYKTGAHGDPTVSASKVNGGTCTTITYTIQP
jgi:hypothetical protein